MADAVELGFLFASAFTSATVLPGSSEAILAGVVVFGAASGVAVPIAVATLGNVLGSVVNWGLGRLAAGYLGHRRFPVSPAQYERYAEIYRRWGVWSLLLSWMPIIGDPLTVVAGGMRTPLRVFLPLVTVAKAVRYAIVAGIAVTV